jgi:poly-gamma-glutamate synthesis protein (capsule biosynthesis protein)
VWVLLGLWLGGCTSAPEHHGAAHPVIVVAAAVPQVVAPAQVTLRVLVGGDVIPHRPQLVDPESVSNALAPLAPLFRSADATVVNYESATGEASAHVDPSMLFLAAKPGWMRAVAASGASALVLANNHACDLGARGLAASIDTADATGVTALGASAADAWEPKTIAAKNGRRVCAIAWTTFVNERHRGCGDSPHLAIAKPDHDGRLRAAKAVANAFHEGCDAVVAIIHGGEEYQPQTHAMMNAARAVAEAGAIAVVMHHPHVVSPLVVYETEDGRKVPIYASVGNLVSNQGESWTPEFPAAQKDRRTVYLNGWTRIGMIADLELSLGARTELASFGDHLVWVDNEHARDKSNPHAPIAARLLDPEKDHAVIEKLSRDALGPRAIFDDPYWIERAISSVPK